MNRDKAREILKDYNDYRRNEGIYDVDEPCEPKFKASEIGDAIDVAIDMLTESDGRGTIMDAVVAESGISIDEIRSENRERKIVVARCVAAGLLRKEGYTLKEIGEMINRSHSNVLHLCESVNYWCSDRERFGRELRLLRRVEKKVANK